jgi:hypothetical protein
MGGRVRVGVGVGVAGQGLTRQLLHSLNQQ